jgi:hypothetical protein
LSGRSSVFNPSLLIKPAWLPSRGWASVITETSSPSDSNTTAG